MSSDASVRYFDAQFQRQVRESDLALNPFERQALPHLRGAVLDYGCGLGNLALAAARQGCSVTALDASHTAIEHLRQAARAESLPISASEADLRCHELRDDFDAVACIGLLMFFDCPTAFAQLRQLQDHVRPGGVAVINVLVEGTTYLGMFDPASHCLFAREEMHKRFAGWEILRSEYADFPAANDTTKSFVTVIARKPAPGGGIGMKAQASDPLLHALQSRFAKNQHRHAGVAWGQVLQRLESAPAALKALMAMESTGGEPDVIGVEAGTGAFIFCDCSAESPSGRRSLCYDDEALIARKENKPAGSALGMAREMGVELLEEAQYRALQQLGEFDLKTSSWIATPAELRALGGALFGDRRYGRIFTYHNGVQSYYAARGFRALLHV